MKKSCAAEKNLVRISLKNGVKSVLFSYNEIICPLFKNKNIICNILIFSILMYFWLFEIVEKMAIPLLGVEF